MCMKYKCQCCGYYTLHEVPTGTFEICEVCYWEDDILQSNNPSVRAGVNPVSLNEARENYLNFGASSKDVLPYVREPYPEEKDVFDKKSLRILLIQFLI